MIRISQTGLCRKPNRSWRDFPLLPVKSINRQVTQHLLRDGTHEIRAGLIAMVPAGLWLAWLVGIRGGALVACIALALGLALAAWPGVTALRTGYVLPRLGYARHTQRTDLAALCIVALVLTGLGLVWLEQVGRWEWGRPASALLIVAGLGYLARESSLGRHYLITVLVAAVAAALYFLDLPSYRFFTALVLATAVLLTCGGGAALRSLVVNQAEGTGEPGRDAPG